MTLPNIRKIEKSSGFTIVELLVVIVVIAILATISIVAYSGIQSRAKLTKAQANANQVQKVAESYFADQSKYPSAATDFDNAISKLPVGVSLLTGTTGLSVSNGENSIDYDYVGTLGNASGGRVRYFDFTTGAVSTNVIYIGNASSTSSFVNL